MTSLPALEHHYARVFGLDALLFPDTIPMPSLQSPTTTDKDDCSSSSTSPVSQYDVLLQKAPSEFDHQMLCSAANDQVDRRFRPSGYISQDARSTTNEMENSPSTERLEIRVIGVPAKSRVETQIRLCIQLLTASGAKVSGWPYLKLPSHLMSRSRLKQSADKASQNAGRMVLSDDSRMLFLDAKVICASDPDKPVKMCPGCILRERKRAQRSKTGLKLHSDTLPPYGIPEQDRILLINCGPTVNFSSGDAILPTRITCYCRHHSENTGFRIQFSLKNNNGDIVATGTSPPIMITDDHKSLRPKSRKRTRAAFESSVVEPVTPGSSRPGSISGELGTLSDPTLFQDTRPPTPGNESPTFTHDMYPWKLDTILASYNGKDNDNLGVPSSHTMHVTTTTPQLERLVPSQGPTYGGTEVTLLGSGFHRGLTCLFGEHAATTVYWNPNTLVCILPPALQPGPVIVSFKEHPIILDSQEVPLFTYYDANDQALLELALQVVGIKMTGKLQDAKQVAMQIVQGDQSIQKPQDALYWRSPSLER